MKADEISKELDLELLFDRESLAHKMSRGSSGMQINAKECPDCGDSRWRVYLNAETGRGNCFVCNRTFNKLSFVHAYLGHGDGEWRKTFEFCEEALRDQGWRPPRTIGAAVEYEKVSLPLSLELPTRDGQNLQYLEDRGVNGDLARYFHLRYCSMGWWNYTKEDGTPGGQSFGERVIIPVFDLDGALVTFQGRDLTGTSERKYLFPIGLPGTGKFLLNGQNVQLTKRVAMGEGGFDVIAMKAAFDEEQDLRDVVPIGSFGKHLSYGSVDGDDQLGRLLKLKAGGLQEVTIMWDGEAKALTSALDAGKLIAGIGLIARIALLPKDKDPNEVPRAVVRQAFYQAQRWTPMLDVKMRLLNPYA